jgi:predicted aspartyl protease
MKIRIDGGLPYTTVSLTYRDIQRTFHRVLLDTGSGGTVFATDSVLTLGMEYEMNDVIHRIRGVGGTEFVFSKTIDRIEIGTLHRHNFPIEVGVMDYGMELDGIIGLDFLLQVGAVIDFARLEIGSA